MARSSRSTIFYGNLDFGGGNQTRPAPIFSWGTETVRDSKGDSVSLRHTLDFQGTILAPAANSGQLDVLLGEREQLQQGLASGNQEFKILFDDIPQLSGIFPRVNAVNFEEGVWVDRINYTFQLEYDENFFGSGIQSFGETWGFEESDDRRTVSVRHDINAVGQNTNASGANNALSNAKTFVLSKTGYDNVGDSAPVFVQVSGTSFEAFEELRSEQSDPQGGSYSLSETFTLSSGNFVHTRTAQFNQNEEGTVEVSFEGNVRGLGRGDSAFDNALSAFNTQIKPSLASDASGIYSDFEGPATLFTNNFNNFSVSQNRFQGTVGYSASYTDDPAENLPSGILEFNLSIQDDEPTRLFASFVIPDRSLGNVIQDIGTSDQGSFSIQGNAQAKVDVPFSDLLSFVQDKINENRPQPVDYQTLTLSSKQITKDELSNSVSFNLNWNYTLELNQLDSFDGPISIN